MAISSLTPVHLGDGRDLQQRLIDMDDYYKNPQKTDEGKFITSYGCNASVVASEFVFAKQQYEKLTGRKQRADKDVIAYQMLQSFLPGETTPEQAHKIAYELAMRFTKGKNAFVIYTHEDKEHIHSHITFNSTALDCTRKFRNFWGSSKAVRRISDRLCLENGLSIIADAKLTRGQRRRHYGKWLGDKKNLSARDAMKAAIDTSLQKKPADYDAFIALMNGAGYEYKGGNAPGFRADGQKRFARMDSLKAGYLESDIRAVISGSKTHTPRQAPLIVPEPPRMNLLVDIQKKLQEGKSGGYERWAKVFNLKQMAQTLNFLQDNDLLDYDALAATTSELTGRSDALSTQIKSAETRMAEISVLQKHIINYSKTRSTYIAYRKAGYSKKFLAANESDIILHKAAKAAFDEKGIKRLPTVKSLRSEYAELLASKKSAYGEYSKLREKQREALTAKANVDRLFGNETASPEPTKRREQR